MLRFKIREYLSENGQSPFDSRLIGLRDLRARARDTKGTQKRDIQIAKAYLADYRKRESGN